MLKVDGLFEGELVEIVSGLTATRTSQPSFRLSAVSKSEEASESFRH
jgi:hypothetical protein